MAPTLVLTPVEAPVEDAVPEDPAPPRSAVTRGRVMVAVAAALVLMVVVPVAFVDWTRNTGTPGNTLLCLVILAISAGRLAQAIAFDSRTMPRSLFYVFVYVFLAVPALAQTVSGTYPLDGLTYSPSTVSAGLWHVLVGVLAYEAGWYLWRRRGEGAPGSLVPRFSFSPWRCVVVGGVGLLVAAYQVAQLGLLAFFTSRTDTVAALTGTSSGGTPYYQTENKSAGLIGIFLAQIPVFIALFAILYARRHRLWPLPATPQRDLAWRGFIAALVAANVVMNNPMGNGRFWFSLVILAFISIYVPFDRRHSQRFYVCSALLILFFSFASLDLYRSQSTTLEVAGPGTTFVENGTYAMFQMELNAIEFVDESGHTDGRQMLGYVFNFVPRAYWADKPMPTGMLVDPPLARSTTAWSEFFVDYGAGGVLVIFLVWGMGSRALTIRSLRVPPGLLHALLPVLAVYQISLLRGSLLPLMGSLYQILFVVALLLARHPARRDTTTDDPPLGTGRRELTWSGA
ncbi:O-antigen polymerase [Actinomycetospora aeridis]|uniref:O-antigen polymerase n=1 Tax=Actinomycetospora aeridis TaxID=3129231 RepID=A0ABU8N6F4_9PSEU